MLAFQFTREEEAGRMERKALLPNSPWWSLLLLVLGSLSGWGVVEERSAIPDLKRKLLVYRCYFRYPGLKKGIHKWLSDYIMGIFHCWTARTWLSPLRTAYYSIIIPSYTFYPRNFRGKRVKVGIGIGRCKGHSLKEKGEVLRRCHPREVVWDGLWRSFGCTRACL